MQQNPYAKIIEELWLESFRRTRTASLAVRDKGVWPLLLPGQRIEVEQTPLAHLEKGDVVVIQGRQPGTNLLGEIIGSIVHQGITWMLYRRNDLLLPGWASEEDILGKVIRIEGQPQSDHRTRVLQEAAASLLVRGQRNIGGIWKSALPTILSIEGLATKLNNCFIFFKASTGLPNRNRTLADILITIDCPVKCRFCLYDGGVRNDTISTETFEKICAVFRHLHVPGIRIMGGEPFSRYARLVECFDVAASVFGAENITVVTSAHWATDAERTRARLLPLAKRGLKRLTVSFDAFHREKIPAERLKNLFGNAGKIDVTVNVHYSDALFGSVEQLRKWKEMFGVDIVLSTVFPVGRARDLTPRERSCSSLPAFTKDLGGPSPVRNLRSGIRTLLTDQCIHMVGFPDGAIHFCCPAQENSLVANVHDVQAETIRRRLKGSLGRNLKHIAAYALRHGAASPFACDDCPVSVR